jgi:glycosyltransferase involved in cell wall biosynthesis
MDILYVSAKRGWGGVMTWMLRTAVGLEARGHRVWIVSHPRSPFTHAASSRVRIIPKRLGMDANPLAIAYLAALIKSRGISVVVTNIQKEVVIGGLAARLCGIPNVRRVGSERDLNPRVRWRQEHLVDHTIVPCDAVLENARKISPWLDPDRFTTIYNGRDPVTYRPEEIAEQRSAWGLSADHLVIGTTAQLTGIKGIAGLVTAFAELAASYPRCRLVVTGQGPDLGNLENLARRLKVADRVVFAGFSVEPTKAAAAYDVAVLNSSIEGFPNALVEYFAAARPVVATDVGGVAEMVKDGENGLVIKPGAGESLVRSLRLLVENAELRRRLGRAAADTLRSTFSEDRMISELEKLLLKIGTKRKR